MSGGNLAKFSPGGQHVRHDADQTGTNKMPISASQGTNKCHTLSVYHCDQTETVLENTKSPQWQ